ncbi:MAG: histidine phosphatase family protein [Sulfurovum sp.]|nr:histidine phosphatase family protein [Sulfurovum sp.]
MIRHAKSDWKNGSLHDFERGLSSKGYKALNTMSAYLSIQKLKPDLILTSLALRAQITADKLAEEIGYKGKIHYMDELYNSRPETFINVLSLQDESYESIFLVGHNPELTEFSNFLLRDNFYKFPALGVLALELTIESWSEIVENCGEITFFIQPKQFKYYVPKQIRTILSERAED